MAALTPRHMQELWTRMVRIYGLRWTSGFGESDDGTWLTGLHGLMPEELANGVRACIDRPSGWPPLLPEFRALCLGIPDLETAVHKALKGDSDDPVVEAMRKAVSSWDFTHHSAEHVERRLRGCYPDIAEKFVTRHLSLPIEKHKLLLKRETEEEN